GKAKVEVEVETLEQLEEALSAEPDIILLDNMKTLMLKKAVALRNRMHPATLLEASGGITLLTVASVAATGVDFVSVGALTHSAPALDLALDYADQ
ncbi:MAG TPA: nicotinate-nucleotide diphosphorylase (carboxylating), partial [Gemmatales bacterium]|nr:nicotinate-nucleotide diphosphorylase (carboxylating) [Gemmatales bacterium]